MINAIGMTYRDPLHECLKWLKNLSNYRNARGTIDGHLNRLLNVGDNCIDSLARFVLDMVRRSLNILSIDLSTRIQEYILWKGLDRSHRGSVVVVASRMG